MSTKKPNGPAVTALTFPLGVSIIVAAITGNAMWFFIGLGISVILSPMLTLD